jgi:hypothetical protein
LFFVCADGKTVVREELAPFIATKPSDDVDFDELLSLARLQQLDEK